MEQYKRKFEEGFRAMDFGPIKNAVYKILMDHTSKSDAIPTGREISESIILGISDSQLPKEEK